MKRPSADIPVYLHRLPVDFRKAINGLSLIVQDALLLDPYSEAPFMGSDPFIPFRIFS